MDPQELERLTLLSRRRFLGLLGGSVGAGFTTWQARAAPLSPRLPEARPSPWPSFRITRPEDHLCLDVELVNLKLVNEISKNPAMKARPRMAHIASHGDSGYIVLRFPGQHYAEQAIWDCGSQIPQNKTPKKEDGIDPPAPVTYTLWREKGEDDSKRNDDLAFLANAPWRVPPPMTAKEIAEIEKLISAGDKEAKKYLKEERIAQELERQRRSRRRYAEWDCWMDDPDPKPWDFPIPSKKPPEPLWNHPDWTPGAAGMWIAGPSQVVFEVPQWRAPFFADAESILRLCTQLDLVVAPHLAPGFEALNRQAGSQEPPLPDVFGGHHPGAPPPVTAIEFPTLLYVTPYQNARWRLRPSVAGGAAELWSLELERAQVGPPRPGTPRERREPGHLFAFARRQLEEARWPLDFVAAPPRKEIDKYGPHEAPKTGLYEATRRLLVIQMREDNGDITADHLSLSGLGASAELRYRPLLEPPGDEPVEVVPPPKDRTPEQIAAAEKTKSPLRKSKADEGLLTEWIHKAKLGRDYYVKEAFAGCWMPWGFRAESVTITERLPTIDPWLDFKNGGARLRKRNLLQEAGLNITPEEFVDLAGLESHLMAFLVARKFARVKARFGNGPLVREFGPGESEDFFSNQPEGSRRAGVRKVEVLVDRTPVLANQYCSVPEGLFENYMRKGLDLRVAGGSGRDAAREIFLPRVRDFARNAEGQLESRLVPYRFPMRFTYKDGRTELVEMPMLFVPDEALGRRLYNWLPDELCSVPVNSKVALVELPSPAAINAQDMGPVKDLIASREAYAAILPLSPKALAGEDDALKKSGSLQMVADGLNAFIEGPEATIMRALTRVKSDQVAVKGRLRDISRLSDFLALQVKKVESVPEDFAKNWNDLASNLKGSMDNMAATGVAAEAQARDILRSAQRAMAWGVDEIAEVDQVFAAERLQQLLRFPAREQLGEWQMEVASAIDAILTIRELLKGGDFTQVEIDEVSGVISLIKTDLNDVKKVAANSAGLAYEDLQVAFGTAMRKLLTQWAARLTGRWQRHLWDPVFHLIARIRDTEQEVATELNLITAAYKKRLQVYLLSWIDDGKDLVLQLGDAEKLLNIGVSKLLVKPRKELANIQQATGEWLDTLATAMEKDAAAVSRLVRGVEEALPDQRGLRLRLHRLAEDMTNRGHAAVKEEADLILKELKVHLVTSLAYANDGRQRFEAFVATVEFAPELAARAQEKVVEQYRKLQDNARKDLQASKLVTDVGKAQEAFKQLLVSTNPERLKQKLNDMVDLTGRRLLADLQTEIDGLAKSGDAISRRLGDLAKRAEKETDNAALLGELALQDLDQIFALADNAAGEFRSTLDRLFEAVDSPLAKVSEKLRTLSGTVQDTVAAQWLKNAGEICERKDRFSWKLGRAAVQLSEDILGAARAASGKTTAELARLRAEVLKEIAESHSVTKNTLDSLTKELLKVTAPAGEEFKARAEALQGWVKHQQARATDTTAYLMVACTQIQLHLTAPDLEGFVKTMLGTLGESLLRKKLQEVFPGIAGAIEGLRGLVGEVDDLTKQVERLKGDVRKRADEFLKTIDLGAEGLVKELTADLKESLGKVEGTAFALAKRAMISLPSPSLLKEFQDQTQKSIFKAAELRFRVGEMPGMPAFPTLDQFRIEVPGLPSIQVVTFTEDYLKNGLRDFESAKGAVFGKLSQMGESLLQQSGLVEAKERVEELSREFGAVASTVKESFESARQQAQQFADQLQQDLNTGVQQAKEAVEEFKAQALDLLPPVQLPKLFDCLPFDKILGIVQDPSSLPKAIANEYPDRIERSRSWTKQVNKVPLGIVTFTPADEEDGEKKADEGKGTMFRLDARAVVYLPKPGRNTLPPSYSVRGQLGAFSLLVADMLKINFASVSFTAENGKFNCSPKLGKGGAALTNVEDIIEFEGALKFMEDVRKTLGSFLSGDSPFRLQVRDDYIFAGLVIAIPNLAFGAVTVTGLSFRTALGLPLGGGPLIFRFALSDRIETFKVAVACYAGGGFFALELSTDPNKSLVEGAIEFGGVISLSLGVADGELSVMAGMFFSRSRASTVLEAYFRACGQVTVFGFIQICLLIMLAMRYKREGSSSSLFGTVTVRIRVKIGFFSKSFSFEYQKKFAGSGGGGSSGDGNSMLLPRESWQRPVRKLAGGGSRSPLNSMLIAADATTHQDAENEREKEKKNIFFNSESKTPLFFKDSGKEPWKSEWKKRADSGGEVDEWPSAVDLRQRPPHARPPRFSESMTPGDWGAYWRTYNWKDYRLRADGKEAKLVPQCQQLDLTQARPSGETR